MLTLRSISWQWDHQRRILWARATMTDGQTWGIGIPLARVVAEFDTALLEEGIHEPAELGACYSVAGFFGRVKRLAKKATRPVRKAVTRTTGRLTRTVTRTVSRYARPVGRYALQAARSRRVGMALGVAAMACPAVGGPALAAWSAANRAAAIYDQAQSARRQIATGRSTPAALAAVNRGMQVQQVVRALPYSSDPRARFAIAALKSMPLR